VRAGRKGLRKAVGADGDSVDGRPLGGVLAVVGVGSLEPGAGVVEVEARGVGGGNLNVDAVEEILLVAMVVMAWNSGGRGSGPVFMTLAEMKLPSLAEPVARLNPTLESRRSRRRR